MKTRLKARNMSFGWLRVGWLKITRALRSELLLGDEVDMRRSNGSASAAESQRRWKVRCGVALGNGERTGLGLTRTAGAPNYFRGEIQRAHLQFPASRWACAPARLRVLCRNRDPPPVSGRPPRTNMKELRCAMPADAFSCARLGSITAWHYMHPSDGRGAPRCSASPWDDGGIEERRFFSTAVVSKQRRSKPYA